MIKMTKLIWALCLTSAIFVSCGDDDDNNGGGGGNSGGNDNDTIAKPTDVLSPEQQKQKLENIGLALLNEINANNYQEVVAPLTVLVNIFDQMNSSNSELEESSANYSCKALQNTVKDIYDVANGKTSKLYTRTENFGDYINAYYMLNFDYHIGENGIICDSTAMHMGTANFYFYDQTYTEWCATLTATEEGNPITEEELTVFIPKSVTFKLYKSSISNNVPLFMNLSTNISAQGTLASINQLTAELSLDLCNTIFKVKAEAGTRGASCNFDMSNGKKLITAFAEITAEGLGYQSDMSDEELIGKLKTASVTADVMSQLQVKGNCSNIPTYVYAINNIQDNSESSVKQAIDIANSVLDMNVYYDNTKTQQASVILAPQVYKDYGFEYWYSEPVLSFDDNTTYTFEQFFTTTDFQNVIGQAITLAENFLNIIQGQQPAQ